MSVMPDYLSGFEARNLCHPLLGEKVRVYRNLNRSEMFSIMSASGEMRGKVLGYARAVHLADVVFLVSQKSRARLLRERCRNVHAFGEGRLIQTADAPPESIENHSVVTYRPFVAGHFFTQTAPTIPIIKSDSAWFYGANAYCSFSEATTPAF